MLTLGAGLPQVRQKQDILCMLTVAPRALAYCHFAAARLRLRHTTQPRDALPRL
jgi:hypothetical protein